VRRKKSISLIGLFALFLLSTSPLCGALTQTAAQDKSAFGQAVDQIIAQEHNLLKLMSYYHPVAETYLQYTKPGPQHNWLPAGDDYYLGQLSLKDGQVSQSSYLRQAGVPARVLGDFTNLYAGRFDPVDFARAIFPDPKDFDRQHYAFTFVRREYLGDVRCLLIEMVPLAGSGPDRFLGRIWVEDQDYHIVRFNGSYTQPPRNQPELHFDSWRLNLLPNVWLPSYSYSEDSEETAGRPGRLRYRAQTRIWGYDLEHAGDLQEYRQPLVDAVPDAARGKSDPGYDLSPSLSNRTYQYSGEDNVVERLQVAGLMAPAGDADQILQTVANNIVITNKLDLRPGIRCRVLLTAPLESFSIGRTIVISRGLLDVLPDEATLAVVLAHELAHIVNGDAVEGKFSAPNSVMFPNEKVLEKLDFHLDASKEAAANQKAMQLLEKSPYKDKLKEAGLFLEQLKAVAGDVPALIQPQLGNGVMDSLGSGMAGLENSAPKLNPASADQIAALPLGSRIKLDPWSDRVEFAKRTAVPLNDAGEKMPFQITPVFPYLRRLPPPESQQASQSAKP
jgi:hypothetical protein